jgi:hypothetical protein
MLGVLSNVPRRPPVSAMGERFLILEETADALDVIDPELASKFRVVNGLPIQPREEIAEGSTPAEFRGSERPATSHEIRMDVGDGEIRCECHCETWSASFDWDEIDTMVVQIREHLGAVRATSGDGIAATPAPVSPRLYEKRVG